MCLCMTGEEGRRILCGEFFNVKILWVAFM